MLTTTLTRSFIVVALSAFALLILFLGCKQKTNSVKLAKHDTTLVK